MAIAIHRAASADNGDPMISHRRLGRSDLNCSGTVCNIGMEPCQYRNGTWFVADIRFHERLALCFAVDYDSQILARVCVY